MSYKIPQLIPYVGEEELSNLKKVIETKWITEGPFTNELIDLIKLNTGAKFAILTNNGTLALYLALQTIGIKNGDEVIVSDFTFNASGSSIVFANGTPVFVDVNEDDFNIDVKKIEEKITKNTKAIMPVHIYGQSADMDSVKEIAKKYDLFVIEDAAQGFGVNYKGQHLGTIGDMGIISFFADKTITMGEGAVILTNNDNLFAKLIYLRNQGRENSGTFIHEELGMNFRVTDLQSAIGVAQIKKFQKIKARKLYNYNLYKSLLRNVEEITFMTVVEYSNLVPFRAAIKSNRKEELMNFLDKHGIQTRGFFYPLHRQPCFHYLNYSLDEYPIANKLFDEGICLPVYCDLKEEEIEFICDTIKKFFTI